MDYKSCFGIGEIGGSAADLQNIYKPKEEKNFLLKDSDVGILVKIPPSKEEQWKEMILTIAWASCFVIGMLCVLVYGIAWFGNVEVTSEDIYIRRNMKKEIEKLQTEYIRLEEHVHRYHDGKIK